MTLKGAISMVLELLVKDVCTRSTWRGLSGALCAHRSGPVMVHLRARPVKVLL